MADAQGGMSKEEKRALAIAKLAKVFGKNNPACDSDSEGEEAVLEAILDAGTLEEAQALARRRLEKGDSSKRYAELVKKEKLDAATKPPRIDAVLRALHGETHDALATCAEYWDSNFRHGLTVAAGADGANGKLRLSDDEARQLTEHLDRTGFFSSGVMEWGDDVSMPRIIDAMAELKRAGWPSAFVFAYHQPYVQASWHA